MGGRALVLGDDGGLRRRWREVSKLVVTAHYSRLVNSYACALFGSLTVVVVWYGMVWLEKKGFSSLGAG